MKTIMHLLSISLLKSYINESERKSGWQDKIIYQLLTNLATNKIWKYGRVGFFSHDSFKIQNGLLWSQRENCYVGYLDFKNEMQEFQMFAIQCQQELESTPIESNFTYNFMSNKQEFELATQVHQIVWHSTTHNFAFPISYYGINNITAHNLNTLIFSLAAKLECIGIHTIGSVCDGAEENRTHIKSFNCKFLHPVYNSYELLANYKTINPITGEDWFFINDPTHVFKKLRNNLSKSHIDEKNAREIMFNGKEISWKHIKGVYEYTNQHATAKATKLTK
ncbi:hypothetical protein C1645_825361 [Glomus cerebriforme]|uniref:Transposable element P transposase-like RNase H domain-containing protein n=1 Tax=Glomus cerebriforme TaxID=658196 RepID=A0A397SWM9_9GLOM|nr:hypothetical protein C1645_825361 [Glomus cerebriforme]